MFKEVKKEIEWGGKKLSIETGKIARQASSVIVTYGDTVVMCNVTAAKKPKEGIDFFPLTVHYQEKYYAGGKIPGGFFKREARPTEKETLTSRMIDRPIRPMFTEGYKNETQIMCTVLSFDGENDSDIISMIGASAALAISPVPFSGILAAAKIAYIDNAFILNPAIEDVKSADLDLTIAGTKDSVLMVESRANELSEDQMLEGVELGLEAMQPVIKMIEELAKEAGEKKWEVVVDKDTKLFDKVAKAFTKKIEDAYKLTEKAERSTKLSEIKEAILEKFLDAEKPNADELSKLFKTLEKNVVRGNVFKGVRIDGRGLDVVRPIATETGLLPRAHGSALFTRGETQALAVVTLGGEDEGQIIDSLSENSKDSFMLHYNFPPYSVGEVGMIRGPGRREIGHGSLARKALTAMLPSKEEYPFTIRIVSEITESNGSSSMATVCASSMAMMHTGVPLKKPVSGIAMGLVKDGEKHKVLSDILGDEDHLGDMDFKVAGSKDGITALQMDIKIQGLTFAIFKEALQQAKAGRLHILDEMDKTIKEVNKDLSPYIPVSEIMKIDTKKIREVIGQGGKVIKSICEESGAKISIDDDGTISICGPNQEATSKAVEIIKKITEYGAFVEFMKHHSGLIHISEFSEKRIKSVKEVVSEGDEIKFKIIGKERDKLKLSYKAVNEDPFAGEANDEPVANDEKPASKKPSRPHHKKPSENAGNSSKSNNKSSDDKTKKKKGFFW
jgi:polyribonucleotide nucleotidyltransferase